MGMPNRWLARRQAAQGSTGFGAARPDAGDEGALTPRLAQEQRIHRKAAAYRAQFQREAAARQAREGQAERERLERAREQYEDDVARGLATGRGFFPGDAEQEREPRIEVLPLTVPQAWIDFQREASDWRQGRS